MVGSAQGLVAGRVGTRSVVSRRVGGTCGARGANVGADVLVRRASRPIARGRRPRASAKITRGVCAAGAARCASTGGQDIGALHGNAVVRGTGRATGGRHNVRGIRTCGAGNYLWWDITR